MEGLYPGRGSDGGYGGRGGPTAARGRGFKGTSENAKTRMCNRWMQGECRFGDRCNFAHGDAELRALPPRDGVPGGRGLPVGSGRGGMRGGYGGRGVGGRFQDSYAGGPGGYNGGYPMGYADGGRGGAHIDQDVYAQSGFPVVGPNGWTRYKAKDTDEVYFHNHRTNVTQWDVPQDWPQDWR